MEKKKKIHQTTHVFISSNITIKQNVNFPVKKNQSLMKQEMFCPAQT